MTEKMTDHISPEYISSEQVQTLDALFRERVKRSPDSVAYRYYRHAEKIWCDVSWAEMTGSVAQMRAALLTEKLEVGDRVALMLSNCCQWVCFEQAALSMGLVVVPLYVNDRPDNIAYILQDTETKLLLIEGDEQWSELAETLQPLENLDRIVSLGKVTNETEDDRLALLENWLPDASSELQHRDASPDDLASIVYTSGTVGQPKGVMLSHRNIISNANACLQAVHVRSDDLFLSFLPLSHMFERSVGYYAPMMAGACVAYARSVPQLAEDLLTIRPTILISVPRIYERVYARIMEKLALKSTLQKTMFNLAVQVGWRHFEYTQKRGSWHPSLLLWNTLKRIVADKVMASLGGRIRAAVCGGAPLSPEVSRLFIGLGLPLLNGYGMTESSPVTHANRLDDNDPKGVGPALQGVEEKIAENDELLVRSPGVMLGYWHNEQASKEAVDEQGWLHTGDKARIENGHVYITGRLKDIIVLSNGEKMPPADMEWAITMDELIEQALVIGEGRAFLAALIVMTQEQWHVLSKQMGMIEDDPLSLESPALLTLLTERIAQRLTNFPGYARVRRIAVMLEPWSVENGLLTPTLKLRRNRIIAQYEKQIDKLYEGH